MKSSECMHSSICEKQIGGVHEENEKGLLAIKITL